MLAVARGKDPAAEKRAERGAGTFAELAARYVESYAKKRNKSWRQADTLVQRYLLPRWGKLQAAIDHPRRRPHHDGPDRRPGAGQPGAGGGLGDLLLGGRSRRSSPPIPAAASSATRPEAASASCPRARCRSSGARSTTPGWSLARP